MKLNDLYKSILATAGLVEIDGCISSKGMDGKSEPVFVKGKRLVLPTHEQLRNSDWTNRIVFHPLAENILHAESDVLAQFRKALNIRINTTLALLSYELLRIATSPAVHAKLSPDQSEYLVKLKNADEKTVAAFRKVMEKIDHKDSQKNMVSIYLKRGGTVDGRKFSRVGVVSFPFYQELLKKDNHEIYGVKVRKLDLESLRALMEYMIPNIDVPHSYDYGSNSQIAPSLDALMHAVLGIASAINDLVELFRNQLDDPDDYLFTADWVNVFENLGVMKAEIQSVPMQAGNEGIPAKLEEAQAAAQPVAAAAPAAAPVFATAPTTPPAAGFGWPGQPAMAAQPPVPEVRHTGRGVDFESLMRSTPALQASVAANLGFSYGQQPMAVMQQQRVPSWARPQMPVMGQMPMGQPINTGWPAANAGWGTSGI